MSLLLGADVSRYQTPLAIEPGHDFAILNHEDPFFSSKLDRCVALGIPYAFYGWLYPGQGISSMARMKAHADLLALNGDQTPTFFWLDYEQNGVTPQDLRVALEYAFNQGLLPHTGVYTYLATVGQVHPVYSQYGAPLWLAYYPGSNNGELNMGQAVNAYQWEAVLWQYTSGHQSPTGERTDMNVVLNEAWYRANMDHQQEPPPPPDLPEEVNDMLTVTFPNGDTWLLWVYQAKVLARKFSQGNPGPVVTVPGDYHVDPANPRLVAAGFGTVLAPSDDGRTVRIAPSAFGWVGETV